MSLTTKLKILAEAMRLAQRSHHSHELFHGVVRRAKDAGAQKQALDVVAAVKVEREVHDLLRREGCSGNVARKPVDAEDAIVDAMVREENFQERHAAAIEVDDEIARLLAMQRQVQRDAYRMKAFVRFRKVADASGDHYIAWHQPDHPVLPLAVPFFVERFAGLRWSILTPDASAHWDGETARFSSGVMQR